MDYAACKLLLLEGGGGHSTNVETIGEQFDVQCGTCTLQCGKAVQFKTVQSRD